jgi:predicted small metal-binding protein
VLEVKETEDEQGNANPPDGSARAGFDDSKAYKDREVAMRAIACPCGHHLEGADDEELVRLAREHVEAHHPEMDRSDEQLRARVAADAYDV